MRAHEGPAILNIGFDFGGSGQHCLPGPSTAPLWRQHACVEVRCGTDTLIFDAGTGIRPLGNARWFKPPTPTTLTSF
jgi:hypothetical protein